MKSGILHVCVHIRIIILHVLDYPIMKWYFSVLRRCPQTPSELINASWPHGACNTGHLSRYHTEAYIKGWPLAGIVTIPGIQHWNSGFHHQGIWGWSVQIERGREREEERDRGREEKEGEIVRQRESLGEKGGKREA